MSWIGRKIYEYLKECEEFKSHVYTPKTDNLGEPPINEESKSSTLDLLKEYFEKTPKEKVLEDCNACQSHILFSGKSFAGLDKRKVGEEMSNAKVRIPRTECLPPAPEQKLKPFGICTETGMLVFCNDAKDYLTYKEKQPERVPFENFKNNRKKMKKEVRHCERYILTSLKEEGKVSITIEPKKGFDVCNVSLNVKTGEFPKEPVFPKELLNPRPELQDQYDTLAKLIATRDYYNAGSVFSNSDIVAVIIVDCVSQDIVGHGGDVRFGKTKSKLYFKNALTADIFLNNFRSEIESVKHLI